MFHFAGWNQLALGEPLLDLKNIAAGQNIGPFVAGGTEGRAIPCLRLLSVQCEGAIFLTTSDMYSRLPEKLIANRDPPTQRRKKSRASRSSINACPRLSADELYSS